jgi:hypothetical protein
MNIVTVMAGLVPAIRVFDLAPNKTWMPGMSASNATPFFERRWPGMTICETASCCQYGRASPSTVVRNISRRSVEGKSVRAWDEQRLSHSNRSPIRQTCS